MIWTYRVFRDSKERYSLREVFYNQSGQILNYSRTPVAVVGASFEELIKLVQWFKEAFDLPVLSLEEIEAQIAQQPTSQPTENQPKDRSRKLSLNQVIADLSNDSINQP